jgi:hypothetical protein
MEPILMRKRPRLVPTDARIPGGAATEGKAGSGLLGLYSHPFVFEVVMHNCNNNKKLPYCNAIQTGES